MAGAATGGKPEKRKVWQAFRQAQRLCGCKTATLKTLCKALKPFWNPDVEIKENDDQLCQDGAAVVLQLHGCVKCNEFVFSPMNKSRRCPKCQHPRYNRKKKPNEVRFLIYFTFCFVLVLCSFTFAFCFCFDF